tara:strand:- start:13 stop:726 length:714 start_codon:yes stop_codon:yes gene_type:complete
MSNENEDYKGVSIEDLVESDIVERYFERNHDNTVEETENKTALSMSFKDIKDKGIYEHELAWLAGVIECEGSITFACQIRGKNKDMLNINPMVSITNSDNMLLDEAKRLMDILSERSFGSKPRFCKRYNHGSRPGYRNPFGYKTNLDCKILTLQGQATKLVLYPCLGFFKSSKKSNAAIVLDYLENRQKNLFKRDKKGRLIRLGYLKSEIEKICLVRQPKKNSVTYGQMINCKNVIN